MSSVKSAKPRLIVFDLDYTLWPFWVDTHVDAPFKLDSKGNVRDRKNRHVQCYPDVPVILSSLHKQGYKLAVASRTGDVDEARQLIELFQWTRFFTDLQIFPGDKKSHFSRLRENTGFSYSEMIFFDDEERNIESVSELGVTCVLVEDGMTREVLSAGLSTHSA